MNRSFRPFTRISRPEAVSQTFSRFAPTASGQALPIGTESRRPRRLANLSIETTALRVSRSQILISDDHSESADATSEMPGACHPG